MKRLKVVNYNRGNLIMRLFTKKTLNQIICKILQKINRDTCKNSCMSHDFFVSFLTKNQQ